MKNLKHTNNIQEISIAKLSTHFESYKFIQPKSEDIAFNSILKFGQLTPIIVYAKEHKRFEIIDGFKRYRALKKLNAKTIIANIVNLNIRTVKAAIIFLNQNTGTITDLEEANIVQSLHNEDKLSQVEIGKLLNRHKSWVSRRISLIERLDEEIINHIKLNLISISIGRELMRLPRGNQEKVMKIVIDYNLSCIETKKLVDSLLNEKELTIDHIKQCTNEILAERYSKSNSYQKIKKATLINGMFSIIEKNISSVSNEISKNVFSSISIKEQTKLVLYFDKIKRLFEILDNKFQELQMESGK